MLLSTRQRHGTARCDQERLPAGPLEEAIIAVTLAATVARATCADRLTELEQELRALETNAVALEAACEATPATATAAPSRSAVHHPKQVISLLRAVVWLGLAYCAVTGAARSAAKPDEAASPGRRCRLP